eukprot:1197180-Rhodomonas_salina.1
MQRQLEKLTTQSPLCMAIGSFILAIAQERGHPAATLWGSEPTRARFPSSDVGDGGAGSRSPAETSTVDGADGDLPVYNNIWAFFFTECFSKTCIDMEHLVNLDLWRTGKGAQGKSPAQC